MYCNLVVTKTSGKHGEELAVQFLIKNGYRILTTNFYSRFGEIDIIAKKNNSISFIEVKTRGTNLFGTPAEAITKQKLSKMIKTAQFYLTISKQQKEAHQFDAIEVFLKNGGETVNLIENITA